MLKWPYFQAFRRAPSVDFSACRIVPCMAIIIAKQSYFARSHEGRSSQRDIKTWLESRAIWWNVPSVPTYANAEYGFDAGRRVSDIVNHASLCSISRTSHRMMPEHLAYRRQQRRFDIEWHIKPFNLTTVLSAIANSSQLGMRHARVPYDEPFTEVRIRSIKLMLIIRAMYLLQVMSMTLGNDHGTSFHAPVCPTLSMAFRRVTLLNNDTSSFAHCPKQILRQIHYRH